MMWVQAAAMPQFVAHCSVAENMADLVCNLCKWWLRHGFLGGIKMVVVAHAAPFLFLVISCMASV